MSFRSVALGPSPSAITHRHVGYTQFVVIWEFLATFIVIHAEIAPGGDVFSACEFAFAVCSGTHVAEVD